MKSFAPLLAVMLIFHSIIYSQNEEFNPFDKDLEVVNAAGGDAFSSEGSVAYSFGTIFYTMHEASDVKVSQGAQQAEEQAIEEEEIASEETDPIAEEQTSQQEEVHAPEEGDPIVAEQPAEPAPGTVEPIPQQEEELLQEEGTTEDELASLEEQQPTTTQGDSESSEQEVFQEEGNVVNQNLVDQGLSDEIQESNEIIIITYPNPTVDNTTLYVENFENGFSLYQLFDQTGRQLESKPITNRTTKIKMNHRSTAIYLLRVVISNKVAKTFKIIKN